VSEEGRSFDSADRIGALHLLSSKCKLRVDLRHAM
jgi:hypothetical protein